MSENTMIRRGEFASANFEADFQELLSCFDEDAFKALASWCRTEGTVLVGPDSTTSDLQGLLELGFCTLYRRQAIVPARPLDATAKAQLDGLLKANPAIVPVTAAAPVEQVDELAEVVKDFKTLRTADFNRKVYENKDGYQKKFEAAVAAGRI